MRGSLNKFKVFLLFVSALYFLFLVPSKMAAEELVETPHYIFQNNTNMCSKCHSTHRGKSAKLLNEQSQEQTCYLCHDGRGSKYDAKNGKVVDPVSGTITESVSGPFNGASSAHDVESSHAAEGGSGVSIQMVCTTCHNPHGSSNHRNLQTTVNGKSGIIVEASVSVSPYSNKEVVSYKSGITNFCISCHEDYLTYYNENPVNEEGHYRHPINTWLTGGKTRDINAYVPNPLTFSPTLFTTLPTEGVPSGAYPLPSSKVIQDGSGSMAIGVYYYIVTAVNSLGESHQGYIKKVNVTSDLTNSSVVLEWAGITNATGYKIYRATKPTQGEPSLTDYKLVATTEADREKFVYTANEEEGTFVFKDINYQVGQGTPPDINSQVNPLDNTDVTAQVVCITCHFAHGTSKTINSTESTKLIRKDNAGVCQNCHKR
ncbi:cytochrome c3 family protein [Neobacillus sp. LXY-4]|uniref:cytochrome c3 family protein n=1 Tax=Neobacillus sp. LXY-4 TaxID=3379826 RepID=UPI003EE2CCB8